MRNNNAPRQRGVVQDGPWMRNENLSKIIGDTLGAQVGFIPNNPDNATSFQARPSNTPYGDPRGDISRDNAVGESLYRDSWIYLGQQGYQTVQPSSPYQRVMVPQLAKNTPPGQTPGALDQVNTPPFVQSGSPIYKIDRAMARNVTAPPTPQQAEQAPPPLGTNTGVGMPGSGPQRNVPETSKSA